MSVYFDSPLVIFEGEDESALRAEYVRLMAKWRTSYTPEQVCQFIFRGLIEPTRYIVAAQVWAQDLELTEAIDNLINGKTANLETKDDIKAQLQAIVDLPSTGAKEKIAALQLMAQMEGLIIKQVEKKSEVNTNLSQRIMFVEDTE